MIPGMVLPVVVHAGGAPSAASDRPTDDPEAVRQDMPADPALHADFAMIRAPLQAEEAAQVANPALAAGPEAVGAPEPPLALDGPRQPQPPGKGRQGHPPHAGPFRPTRVGYCRYRRGIKSSLPLGSIETGIMGERGAMPGRWWAQLAVRRCSIGRF
jgi:hypothetical protein